MPDDGFATDNVLGLSQAFEKFLNPLMDNKIAYISVLPDPSQRWDVYLYPDHIDPFNQQQQPSLPSKDAHPNNLPLYVSSISCIFYVALGSQVIWQCNPVCIAE